MTQKLVKVPKEKLRAKRKLAPVEVVSTRGNGVAEAEDTKRYDMRALRSPGPLAIRPKVSATETYLAGKREGASRATMLSSLKVLAGILAPKMGISEEVIAFPWHDVDLSIAAGLRSHLQANYALASANLHLSAMRGVLRISAGLGLMTIERREQALMGLKHIKGHTEETGRALPSDEVELLFKQCDRSTGLGKRDELMVTLLFGCGLRCEEATVLDLSDIRYERGRASLLVSGKGGKQRRVTLVGKSLANLERWLKFRGRDEGPLFLTDGKSPHRLSKRGIYDRVVLLAEKAAIDHIAPHDLRRTFVTTMLDKGYDLDHVSDLVGHASLETTRKYDKRPETRRRDAHESFLEDVFGKMDLGTGGDDGREDDEVDG